MTNSDNSGPQPRRRASLAILPLAIFAALALVLWIGLYGNPRNIPSTLIGKPVPTFELQPIEGLDVPGFKTADLKGHGVSLVNIFASWCVPCRVEHPLLVEMAKRPDLRIYGINNKDKADDAKRYLTNLGQPYAAIGADTDGRTSIDWGGYGVPESFVVDNDGTIRFKWTGPLTPDVMKTLNEEIEKAKQPPKTG